MVKYIEFLGVLLGPWLFLAVSHFLVEKSVFFSQMIPLALVLGVLLVWWNTLVKCFRDTKRFGHLLSQSIFVLVCHALACGGVYYKAPKAFFKGVDAVKQVLISAAFPPAVWGAIGLCAITVLGLPFLLAPAFEKLLKDKTQRVFISHQEKIASFLNEEESVKKAFLAYEGRSLLWCLLFARTVLVLWTDSRVIIISESRDKRIPAHIRVLTLLSMRAVRARDPFLSPFGILVEIELLNRLREPLWPLSRVLGEDMAESLAGAVQQLKVMQGVYEGPVMNHICPFCFADAGKGKVSHSVCPVCGRSLRESFFQILASRTAFIVPLVLGLAIGVNHIRPRICGIARAANGHRIILDSDRLRSFDAKGDVSSSVLLPDDIRGKTVFVKTIPGYGTVTGGGSALYKWSSGTLSRIWTATDGKRIHSADAYGTSSLVVVSEKNETWYLSQISRSGKVQKEHELSCLIDKPKEFIGTWKQSFLFAMGGGGVARYLIKGNRAGWFVEPVDTGLVQGGIVFNSSLIGIVDLEDLGLFSVSSDRADIFFALDGDGVITKQVSLGEKRLLPRFLTLVASAPQGTVRPDLICRGTGNEIWLLDLFSARFVRITEKGEILSDFSRGRMSQWISEVRMWTAFSVWAVALCVFIITASFLHYSYKRFRSH